MPGNKINKIEKNKFSLPLFPAYKLNIPINHQFSRHLQLHSLDVYPNKTHKKHEDMKEHEENLICCWK